MRRDFHHQVRRTAREHGGRQARNFVGLRGRMGRRLGPVFETMADGADDSRSFAVRFEGAPDQMTGRRFSIGAGDADHREQAGRIAIDDRRRASDGDANIRHDHDRNAERRRRELVFGQKRDGAVVDGFAHVLPTAGARMRAP